ncbi:MAG: ABC transporter permease [Nitrospirota bacterium]
MFRNKLAIAGAVILIILVIVAIAAPILSPYNPFQQNITQGLSRPSNDHILGQDRLGRDILSRIIYGSRISLSVGISVVGISLIVGITIGALAGFYGGLIDEIFMRIADILLAFPGILLAIAFTAVMGPDINNVIIALSLLGWVGYARIVRGQILYTRELDYVIAAKAIGVTTPYLITFHILPNIIAPVIVEATFGLAGVIIAESGLSFLGLGIQPPTPSWGAMLNEGREFILIAPHLITFPGIAIMLVVMSINFVGDGLRDMLDVKG